MAERIRIVVDATNNASAALESVKRDLSGIGENAQTSSINLGRVAQGLQAAFSAAIVQRVAATAVEMARMGAGVQATERRFEALAGGADEAAYYLRALREATRGTMSEMDMMTGVSQLMSMGLADNAAQAAELTAMAVALGYQTQTAGERLNDFSLMLANQSVMRLDNFGISSGRVRQRIEELQAATPGLTREMAFMQATVEEGRVAMERLGDSIENQAASWDRLDAAVEDSKNAVRSWVADALTPAAEGLAMLLTYRQRVDDMLASNTDSALEAAEGWSEYARRQYEAQVAAGRQADVNRDIQMAALDAGYSIDDLNRRLGSNADFFELAAEMGYGFGQTLDRNAYYANAFADAERSVVEHGWSLPPMILEQVQGLDTLAAATETAARRYNEATLAANNFAAGLAEMSQAQYAQALIAQLEEAGLEGAALAEASRAILTEFGLLTGAEAAAARSIGNITQTFADGNISVSEYIEAVTTVRARLDNLTEGDAIRQAIEELNASWDPATGDVNAYTAALDELNARLDALNGRQITIGVDFNIADFALPSQLDQFGGYTGPQAFADGGVAPYSGAFTVGERGPEQVFLPAGSRVTPASVTYNDHSTYQVNDELAAQLLMAQQRQRRRAIMERRL